MSSPTSTFLLQPSVRTARLASPLSSRPALLGLAHRSPRARALGTSPLGNTAASHIASHASVASGAASEQQPVPPQQAPPIIYEGPLATTFRRLKIFSLSSFACTTLFSPFLFVLDSSLPFIAQASLAGTVLTTTVISTALVGWTGQPYVTSLRRTLDGTGLEMQTASIKLNKLTTTVYDPAFLAPTRRPFASWQLAQTVRMPATAPTPGTEETVAETRDEKGEVRGRWIVTWGEGGEGTCRESGKVLRYFHVHEELLDPSLRIGGSASVDA